jgi:hypothetical protein
LAPPRPLGLPPAFWAAVALGLGLAAMGLVQLMPPLAFWLFVAAGLALAVSAWGLPWATGMGLWRPSPAARRPWEIPFFAALVVLTVLPRVLSLNDLPAGAGGHEGEMVGQMLQMDDSRDLYIHIQDGDINWPSLLFYQGLGLSKVFGLQPKAYRLSSALWGILAVLAFYFLLRALFSPEAAAGASLMFAGSFYHLVLSRIFFPGTVLNFSVIVAFAFLIESFRRRSPLWAGLAGAAAGLSLWGFIPGRGVPAIFVVWLLFVAVFLREQRPTRGQWLAFLGVLFVVCSPIIYYALRWPQFYWTYVTNQNPNRGQGLLSYLHTLITESGPYFKAFHLQGDVDAGMSPPGQPMLDNVAAWLFPIGLFAALAYFWRPVNAFLIGLFLAGIMPAVLGAGFAHPTTRRMVLAWPAVFMMIALVFETVRRSVNAAGDRRRDLWLGLAFVTLGALSYARNVQNYFCDFYTDPEVVAHIAHDDYRIYRAHREDPGSDMVTSPIFQGVVWGFYFPRVSSTLVYEPEDLLRLDTDHAVDIYLDPLYEGAADFIRTAVPSAKVDDEASPYYPDVQVSRDPMAPQWLFTRIRIPAGGLAAARGMDLDGRRSDVFGPGFAGDVLGRRIALRATLVAPRKPSTARLLLAWPGFRAKLDSRPLGFGEPIQLEGGVHELSLEGRVPAGATGALPLSLELDGQATRPLLYPLRWPYGVVATFFTGSRAWKTAPRFSRRFAVSSYRFHDLGEVFLPFSIRLRALLVPTVSGDYRLATSQWGQLRVMADGRQVFDDLPGETQTAEVLRLTAGKPVSLDMYHEGFPGGSLNRAFQLLWRKPGSSDPEAVPSTDLESPQWASWWPGAGKPKAAAQ